MLDFLAKVNYVIEALEGEYSKSVTILSKFCNTSNIGLT